MGPSGRILLICTALALLLLGPALSQDSTGLFSSSYGDSYSYRAWAMESGLPQNTVTAITQTRDGYLWIATFGGLARFNGVEIRVFDLARHRGLVSNRMLALFEDSRGILWIGHEHEGLSRYSDGRFTPYRQKDGLPGGGVRAIVEDREGALWIGTDGSGLARLRGGQFESFTERDGLPSLSILSLFVDHQGVLWVGTTAGLARSTDTTHFTLVDGVPKVRIDSVFEDRGGTLWAATAVGVIRRHEGRWQHYLEDRQLIKSGAGNKLAADHRGQLWFIAEPDTRLYRIADHGHTTDLPSNPGIVDLLGSRANTLFVDREDNIWVGTIGNGFYSLRLRPVQRWTVEDGLASHEPRVLLADGEGGFWIAADCEMPLTRWYEGTFTVYPTDANGEDLSCVGSLLRDRQGNFWLGSGGDLVRLQKGHVAERHELVELREQDAIIHALFEDHRGRLWIGFWEHGLARFEHGEVVFYTHRDGLVNDNVCFITEDREGALWIGTNDGLSRFRDGVFDNYTQEDGLPAGMVRAIHQDADGTLWIGTYGGGLGRLRDGVVTRITKENGLYDNVVTRILEDERGNLWMLGNRGLFFANRRNLNAFADGETASAFSVAFGRAEGMAEGSGGRQPAGWRTDDGKMWWPTTDGVAMIDAKSFRIDPLPPPLVIEGAMAGRRELDMDPTIVLPAHERDLEIHYTGLSFATPERIRFKYKLEGHDDDWREVGSRRIAYYTNLPPGTYTFRVTASNHSDIWNKQEATVPVQVLPPLWRTGWAYAIYTMALAGVILGYLRWQHKRVEQERTINRQLRVVDKLKDEFLANTSHELRTPLYGMTGLAESLIDGARGELPQAAKLDLGMIVLSGQRLGTLINDLLDFSKLKHQSLELDREPVELRALVEVVLTLSSPLVGSKPLQLRNAIPLDLPLAEADRNRLQQILHNLVGNAIKFTEAGWVEVSAKVGHHLAGHHLAGHHLAGHHFAGDHLEICVADTGSGIPEDKQEQIFKAFEQADAAVDREHGGTGLGLAVSRQLVELHGGEIRVESSPGEGSRFFFSLPISGGSQKAASAPAPQILVIKPTNEPPPDADLDSAPGEATPNILVVDDEPVNRQVLRNHLAAQSLNVATASSGEEALRMLGARSFDLVLLDVMMPKMSGFEVCRALRETHSLEQLPVIFLTAKNQAQDVVTGLALGANDYLTKPISRDELLARIQPHLELVRVYHKLEDLVEEKMSQVKVLRGLLPICSSCKRIRDDDGYWSQLEEFIDHHSEANFSHGICPDCSEEFYGRLPGVGDTV